MTELDQADYYMERTNASRDLAQRAAAPNIATIHAELASRFEKIAAHYDGSVYHIIRNDHAA